LEVTAAIGRHPEFELIGSQLFRRALQLDPRIETVISKIQNDAPQRLDMEKLARQANMSSSHLRHLFKLHTGLTIMQYFKLIRMQQAEHLLRTTFLSVKEIMNRVGITNESYFSREFKKAHGLAPSKYRASYARKK
jgi:AraC family transcriptional regulator, arabinose operon regulatory protein